MSEPTRDELVTMARGTFGEAAARELADHLAVSLETCGVGGDGTNGE
ncbi:hypothetical protein MKK65_29615 [Methylobacterium sp. J-001]|nr:hypothetical protein [Methylobacterium sp. J-001]MCJ2120666.1 hypothetical protein [Methylobacterium sp. J-001]